MVEGIAEALLLPVLAKIAGGSLKQSAVSVLNAAGLNFDAFLPLFGKERLEMPLVILTDSDAVGDEISSTAAGLKAREADLPNLRVEIAEQTFEYELARSDALFPHMMAVFQTLHPIKAAELRERLSQGRTGDRAQEFLDVFLQNRVSKGRFAQELASVLEEHDLDLEAVPLYIRRALAYLGVTSEE